MIHMEQIHLLNQFIRRLSSDARATPIHISFAVALIQCWMESPANVAFKISRRMLMPAAKIHSTATYHKVLKDLQRFGYLEYRPSYHPIKASLIRILVSEKA